ncbi:spore germination protein [Paenibacillus sp. GCM10023248]|uniref:spore germination protein n=1 Tax=Bacillales TaxID=1385 RepID=UPI002379B9AB|nr:MULTISPECIES: spore germination protein [Bacillales]MDD9269485.1 spore germination protein [Paenibacillus sp. MAHUQ-63]MDR6880897.1 spore germination protein KA [Bacillus sp. 3255]
MTQPLSDSITENLSYILESTGNSDDIVSRTFRAGPDGQIQVCLLYTDGLTDKNSVQEFVITPLMNHIGPREVDLLCYSDDTLFSGLKEQVLTVGAIKDVQDHEALIHFLLSGQVILLIEGISQALSINMSQWEDRGVSESSAQSVVRGPKEAFTENLRTNTSLLRRKIKDRNLWLESISLGQYTKTNVAIMYIHGLANDKIVEEVRSRLGRIQIDGILESSYIEEMIEDKKWTPFPTVFNSERPDVIAAGLLEGRVAILVDGTPFVLLVPALFVQFYQAAEDHYQRADISTLIRFIRIFALFIALSAPSLYIAITTFHQEMLPTRLLMSLAAQREGVPFPAFIEALMMEITFEILREAGIRMPKTVGQAISIVGSLVIGQAAVEAGIVSAAMVIVVAITAISSFVLPSYNISITIRMLRFILMGLAASFGLYGVTIGTLTLLLHMCSLRSFGVPYMSPFAPFIPSDQDDALFRLPRWMQRKRPRLINQTNTIREEPAPHPKSRGSV